jgi:hypothetical protein
MGITTTLWYLTDGALEFIYLLATKLTLYWRFAS